MIVFTSQRHGALLEWLGALGAAHVLGKSAGVEALVPLARALLDAEREAAAG